MAMRSAILCGGLRRVMEGNWQSPLMTAFRFKSLPGGNVWNRELTMFKSCSLLGGNDVWNRELTMFKSCRLPGGNLWNREMTMFKSCRVLGGNVWNRELTIVQRRILKGLRRKGRFLRMTKNQHSNIQLERTRKLSHFYGDLSVTRTDRRSYIPFLLNLERRLDVSLVRIRFCQTLPQARQLISHGRVCVNHQVVNRIRWKISPGDLISFKENDVTTHEKIRRSLYVRFLVDKVIGGSLHRPIRVWRRIKTRWYRNIQTKQQWRQLLQSKFLSELRSSVQSSTSGLRYFSDSRGRVLSEEECAKETVYIQKMERERMEKLKKKTE